MTREATAARSDGSVLDWREERDDTELRKSLDAFLRDPASAHASGGVTGNQGFEGPAGDAGTPAPSTASAPRRSAGLAALRLTLVLLGGLLAIAGAALMADTITGSRVFDQARLAEAWPPALVIVGLVTLAQALLLRPASPEAVRSLTADARVPAPGSGASAAFKPAVAIPVMLDPAPADIPVAPPGEPAVPRAQDARGPEQDARRPEPEATNARDVPEDEPLPAGVDVRPAPDALAVLLELQALRRNRLISRKQYRAKRRAVVAGIAPRFVGSPWPDAGIVGHPADTGSARPLAYWGPTAE